MANNGGLQYFGGTTGWEMIRIALEKIEPNSNLVFEVVEGKDIFGNLRILYTVSFEDRESVNQIP